MDLYDKQVQAAEVKKSVKPSSKRDLIIAIDAGHGGDDPGAMGPGRVQEKDVVMANRQGAERAVAGRSGFPADDDPQR